MGQVRYIIVAAAVAVASAAGVGTADAKPVEYAKICSLYGSGWFYIPGTDTCINTSTGETRVQTELGTKVDQSELAGRVSETEAGVEETQSEIDATNADLAETNSELAKTNKQVNKQQKQINDLQESQSNLEQRFDNAFDQSLDGIAIAMALAGPDLVADERFAVKFNVGTYSGRSAFGLVVAAVLARTNYGRVSISGGVATTGENTGGNVAVQLAW
jgi:TolA-binding protein